MTRWATGDNDLSYRCRRQAIAWHFAVRRAAVTGGAKGGPGIWRSSRFGCGRLDVVARHPERWMGDAVLGA